MTTLPVQKTHHGRTAGGWIRKAEYARSMAGDWCIWIPDGRRIVGYTAENVLVLADGYTRIRLEMSPWAARRIRRMAAHVDHLNRYDHRNDSIPNTKEN